MKTFLRRTVWTVVVLATLVALLYAEEDWRGARALRAAEADYKRAGISLEFKDYIPKAIPDSENLGALPVFALTYRTPEKVDKYPQALAKALRADDHLSFPSAGSWQTGHLADFDQINSAVAKIYAQIFKAPPPTSVREQLDALFPVLGSLRQASITRTQCRFDSDYAADPPFARPFTLITDQISLARLFMIHGLLALHEHEPVMALDDLRTMLVLEEGTKRDPSLVAGLVAAAVHALVETLVYNGLAQHAWNEPELKQLQESLSHENFLLTLQSSAKAENAAVARLFFEIKRNPSDFLRSITGGDKRRAKQVIDYIYPVGWIDLRESSRLEFLLGLEKLPEEDGRILRPAKAKKLFGEIDATSDAAGTMVSSEKPFAYLPRNFSVSQTYSNEAVIACALERYRLQNGRYPDALEALQPFFPAQMPRDVVNGEPYHYRLNPDGSYLLYSIGWNEKDDGGAVVMDPADSQHHRIDYDQGDWVWFGSR